MKSVAAFFVVALICLAGIHLMSSGKSHDPHWWHQVGIEDHKAHHQLAAHGHSGAWLAEQSQFKPGTIAYPPGTSQATEASRGKQPVPKLVPGVHYDADYDVGSVKNEPYPYTPTSGFRYVPDDSPFPHVWVSMKPRIVVMPNFLSEEECDAIVSFAEPRLSRSRVVPHRDSKSQQTIDDVRTSQQTWLDIHSAPAKVVVDRILKLTGFQPQEAEALQVLRYREGQKYNSHNDYFDPKYHGKQASNRAATAYFYLSTVPEGGETVFPRADGKPPMFNYTKWDVGLRLKPMKGTLAVFYDMLPDLSFDPHSLHGAAPPRNGGVKWGGTLWLRKNTP